MQRIINMKMQKTVFFAINLKITMKLIKREKLDISIAKAMHLL